MNNLYQTYYSALSAYDLTRRMRPTLGEIAANILPYASREAVLEYVVLCMERIKPLHGLRKDLYKAATAASMLLQGQPLSFAALNSIYDEYLTLLGDDRDCDVAEGRDPRSLAIKCSMGCVDATERYQRGYVQEAIGSAIVAVSCAYFTALNADSVGMIGALGAGLREVALQVDGQQIAAWGAQNGLSQAETELVSANAFEYVKTQA